MRRPIVFELLVCFLAIAGLYALFLRLAVWLTPRDGIVLAIRYDGEDIAYLLALAHRIRFSVDLDKYAALPPAVLMEESDPIVENALREEGVSVYIKK